MNGKIKIVKESRNMIGRTEKKEKEKRKEGGRGKKKEG